MNDDAALPRVYLCGPIADDGAAARGGYQACNRRTIDALRRGGLDVAGLAYPHPRAQGWSKRLAYLFGFARLYARVLGCERGSILHLTALAVHFVYVEWPLLALARLRGCRVVYDMRAGAGQWQYERRSPGYRLVFRSCVRLAHEVLVEGEALLPFVGRFARRAPGYLPNHLDTDRLPWRDTRGALPAAPTLAYVGRIVPEKGVETLLQAARALRERGLAVRVEIAGDGASDCLRRLQALAQGLDVRWHGPLPSAAVLALLQRAHFFVFATRHLGEGQSNALTEAMACGCVPIASRHGFNEAVLGSAEFTLAPDASPKAYADAMQRAWPRRWPALSDAVQRRARERFSTAAAVRTLLAAYRRAIQAAPAGVSWRAS
jgi:glycosyltransferase involved in cell wall biosynthesis